MTIGEKIRQLREAKGLTQEDLAKALGFAHKTSISKIETDKYDLSYNKIIAFAEVLGVTPATLFAPTDSVEKTRKKTVSIPVLGRVVAGYPMEAIENILDYEEIPEELAKHGEYFALQVKGDSMEPRFKDGDVVIVRKQEDVDSGEIAIFLINGDEATIKKVQKFDGGINLVPTNPAYNVLTFSKQQTSDIPVVCLGKVVELRAKF